MSLTFKLPQSLKARLTLWSLVALAGSSVLFATYVERVLHPGLERVLATQHKNASDALADQIDRELKNRQTALNQVATIAGRRAASVEAQQALLDDLPVFQSLFSGGAFITDAQGVVTASYPASRPLTGINFSDRDYIAQPLATGLSSIGRPVTERVTEVPALTMSSAIRNANGEVVGVIAGVVDLDQSGFLHAVETIKLGAMGEFMLLSARDGMVITGTARGRLLTPMPPAGANPAIDNIVRGFEGTSVFVDRRGIEVLASSKRLSSVDWYAVVSLPTNEVFAPAHDVLKSTLVGIGLLALAAALLTWYLMRRELQPLSEASAALGRLTQDQVASGCVPRLAVARQDEIGTVCLRFNELVDELTRQRQALVRSESLYSAAFNTTPNAICIARLSDGVCLRANENFERMFGWTNVELASGSNSSLWRRPEDRLGFVETLQTHGRCEALEAELVTRDGGVLFAEVVAVLMELDGVACVLSFVHDISVRRLAQAQIESLAFSDTLTGLPNRQRFTDLISQAVSDCASGSPQMALLCVSVDDFKLQSERLGHEKGEQILREMARRLLATAGAGDHVARLGGDEFSVLLQDLGGDTDLAQARALAAGEALLARLHEPMQLDELVYQGSVSAGITMLGGDRISASDLLHRADIAMTRARTQGRNRLCMFEPIMRHQLEARLELENELRAALKSGDQLLLNYQPQVDEDGHILGAEALIRWKHPTRGLVPPGEFIQLAEEAGLIIELGGWVLQQACAQLSRWQGDKRLGLLKISVNVSSRQFEHPAFVQQVLEEVAVSGILPERLMLELTESLLVDNIDAIGVKMTALRNRGIRFALDDFGTGFSSLAYLKQLPLDELKIDQSFVRDIELNANDLAIARAVVALGDNLGLAVVAEGVESVGQRDLLARLGCRYFQGYLFSHPLSVGDFEAFARANAVTVIDA